MTEDGNATESSTWLSIHIYVRYDRFLLYFINKKSNIYFSLFELVFQRSRHASNLFWCEPIFPCFVQVGSLVDSSDIKSRRNAVYRYLDTISSAVFGFDTPTRTTLVQTIKQLKHGDEILVFYGSEYNISAMPTTSSS